eukprot:TRINITY_DN14568_c0_g2_i1.p1 TRINITY_DN14568_c0_g2~~TRINITY_DN14568_c0_g2_i1.p1  ORF type:complete len:192 (-),score=53.85 TRINITY_DN14568_c0_g2_i1:71-646(-)
MTEPEELEKVEPVKVALYHSSGIKQAIDDSIIKHLTVSRSLPERHVWTDVRIVLAAATCALAAWAHFTPIPFPENSFILILFCASYIISASATAGIMKFILKNSVVILKGGQRRSKSTFDISVNTTLEQYSSNFIISANFLTKGGPEVKKEFQISEWIDCDGILHTDLIDTQVDLILSELLKSEPKVKKSK